MYFRVPEETDATKSTTEELEQVALFQKFLERKFHLGIGLHPELRYPAGSGRTQAKLGSQHSSNILLPRPEINSSKKMSSNTINIGRRRKTVSLLSSLRGSGVLWVYRTTTKSSTGETPFSLVYGAEALFPTEVGETTMRYFRSNEEANNDAMLVNLELLDERRDLAHIRMATLKQRIERYYNRRANLCYFKVADFVLRKVTQNTRELNVGKLGPTWEGPYQVSPVTGKGSYELENQDGEKFPSN
uniref:Reverse transcriptase domain-containing protein n=1 Tax=Nicotiana tabacum TaxID=4097 RepID=A0A1S4CFR6_TOBAC|nr:PREDICTED: uncharacterized protein LOC107818474 [Nicotiana tabacum]